jgi:molybdenum cofactor synthesis domain-containing protein
VTVTGAPMRVAILTISDAGARGEREDVSGAEAARWATARGGVVAARAIVPDNAGRITSQLIAWCDDRVADLLLTTGGTGLAPRDVTPEATREALDREAPGIAEAIRADSIAKTKHALLSRGLAGTIGNALVVNFPGSPGGCRDGFEIVKPVLAHAVELLAGETDVAHKQT